MKTVSYDFSGSVVLVTGGGTGIGLGIAKAFIQAGATVVITGRRKEKLDQVDGATGIVADVSDPAQVRQLVADVVDRFGRLDVVVPNAAGYFNGPLTELSDDDWASMRATNVDGFFYLAKAVIPHLVESGGSIVAVSSISGQAGDWGQAGYNATKAAVSNFVRSLALDLGDRGVRVNAVAPAVTNTDITAGFIAVDELRQRFENRIALGRVGETADIAPAVLFLASDAAAYVTGVVLPVDGGTQAATGQAHI